MPRTWTAGQKDRALKAGREAYDNLDPNAQDALWATFLQGATTRKRRWTRDDLWQFLQQQYSRGAANLGNFDELWNLVDANNSNSLDFFEVGTVVFLLRLNMTRCRACTGPILDDAMWTSRPRAHPNAADRFNVCLQCYDNRPDQYCSLYRVRHDPFVRMFTCSCCGAAHAETAAHLPGVPGHVFQRRVDGRMVCEWCAAWRCSGCGDTLWKPTPDPNLWSGQGLRCQGCAHAGRWGPYPPLDPSRHTNCPTCSPHVHTSTGHAQPQPWLHAHPPPAPPSTYVQQTYDYTPQQPQGHSYQYASCSYSQPGYHPPPPYSYNSYTPPPTLPVTYVTPSYSETLPQRCCHESCDKKGAMMGKIGGLVASVAAEAAVGALLGSAGCSIM
ncbi:hypothetical protein HYH03_012508 [Edaphochlamys debaryana]|uniref:Uncharacterized protein n=1 Tax=Edaphochlamys debaryana TaxID=47281 RepID=A0A836BUH2_9CHLO|nr:hypothetical protein HYH03_012508 [Edaphochlamys debaryana]|eukprot:KAG2489072.1 hypothetical protein HYH03_012508 [Edaphochlamys debaryana]